MRRASIAVSDVTASVIGGLHPLARELSRYVALWPTVVVVATKVLYVHARGCWGMKP